MKSKHRIWLSEFFRDVDACTTIGIAEQHLICAAMNTMGFGSKATLANVESYGVAHAIYCLRLKIKHAKHPADYRAVLQSLETWFNAQPGEMS
jgi:hypothetical protein